MRHHASLLKSLPKHADALEFTKLFHSINFARMLRVAEAELVRYDMKEGLETLHEVTPYLCRSAGDAAGHMYLSAGVITAMFDEVSTAACILQDKTHRPGVSVALDVEVLQNVPPGTKLRLKTWGDKMGKNLAFCRLDLRDEATGHLIAVGKHCKYLPTGALWDAAFTPALYPILRQPLMHFTKKHVEKGEVVPDPTSKCSIFDYFPLENLKEEGEGAKTTASMHIKPRHCNGLFKMHGGALAVVVEEVALRDAAAKAAKKKTTTTTPAPPPRVRAINLHYLQANSRVVDLAAWLNEGGSSSQVEVTRGGKLCNLANIVWQ